MKALSIWQPWASLIALQLKRFETRSWDTRYRGPLLICAAKRVPPREILGKLLWNIAQKLDPPEDAVEWFESLPRGKAVCVADLKDIVGIKRMFILEKPWLLEEEFGDFSLGRFAWDLQNVRRFSEPFPVRGYQGLFDVPDALVEKALRTA